MRLIVTRFLLTTILASVLFMQSVHAQSTNAVTITFWHPYGDNRAPELEELLHQYDDLSAPSTAVDVVVFQDAGLLYDQLVLQLLAEQGLPTVAVVWPFEAALFDLTNAVVDLTPHMNTHINSENLVLDPTRIATDPVTGELLGLPPHLHMHALYINMDALNELGTETPTTLPDLADSACAFKENNGWSQGSFGTIDGLTTVADSELLFALAAANGHTIFTDSTFDFNTDEMRTIINELAATIADGCMATVTERSSAIDQFASGRSLFHIDTTAVQQTLAEAIAQNYAQPFQWAIAAIPGSQQQPFVSAPVLVVFEHNTATVDAALRLLNWLVEPTQNDRWASAVGSIPVASTQQIDTALQAPMVSATMDFSQYTALPAVAGYDVIRLEVQFVLQSLLVSTAAMPEDLDTLSASANRIWQAFYGIDTGDAP